AFLNSWSHAGKLRVPQGTASAALAKMVSPMLTAKTQRKIIEIRTDWLGSWRDRTTGYVGANRGQNKAWASQARWGTSARFVPNRWSTITGGSDRRCCRSRLSEFAFSPHAETSVTPPPS